MHRHLPYLAEADVWLHQVSCMEKVHGGGVSGVLMLVHVYVY